jgi:hypothetical protein
MVNANYVYDAIRAFGGLMCDVIYGNAVSQALLFFEKCKKRKKYL